MSGLSANRRRFLESAAKGGAALACTGLVIGLLADRSRAMPATALRPPGALPEGDFLGACVRCGLCVRDCPYGTLKLADLGGGGRTYCSWVCPINPVTDAAHWLHRKLGLTKGWQPKAGTRYGMLALVLIGSAATGTIFWEFVNPVTMAHRALVFGLAGAWLIIGAIFLFDLLVSRRGWCSHLCPVGAFYGQINRASLVKISAARREDCDDCMDCFAVCPEPQVITPALKGKGGRTINNWACTNCARCIDVCSKDVFRFTLRGMETNP